MPESPFVRQFKIALRERINDFFEKKGLPLIAVDEFGRKGELYAPDFGERKIVDIGILSKNPGKKFRIVALEIEYVSSTDQVRLNFQKLLNYANRRRNSKVGLLHVIFWECQIFKKALVELARVPLVANKSSRFYYHLLLYDSHVFGGGRVSPACLAELLFNDWKFGGYFFALLGVVFGKKSFDSEKLAGRMPWW